MPLVLCKKKANYMQVQLSANIRAQVYAFNMHGLPISPHSCQNMGSYINYHYRFGREAIRNRYFFIIEEADYMKPYIYEFNPVLERIDEVNFSDLPKPVQTSYSLVMPKPTVDLLTTHISNDQLVIYTNDPQRVKDYLKLLDFSLFFIKHDDVVYKCEPEGVEITIKVKGTFTPVGRERNEETGQQR